MTTAAAALNNLRSDPETFLLNYPVVAVGSNTTPVPRANYLFGYKADSSREAGVRRRVPDGSVIFEFNENRNFLLGPAQSVCVWYVPMVSESDPGIINNEVHGVTVTRNNGPDLMITPLFSGCTFICSPLPNGTIKMAHLQPGQGRGLALKGGVARGNIRIRGVGDNIFQNTRLFGPGNADQLAPNEYSGFERCQIIGFRTQQTWRVYAQVQGSAPGSRGNIDRVEEVFIG